MIKDATSSYVFVLVRPTASYPLYRSEVPSIPTVEISVSPAITPLSPGE